LRIGVHRRGDDLRDALLSGRLEQRAHAAGAGSKRSGIHAQGGMRQARAESKDIGSERGRRVVLFRRHVARRAAVCSIHGAVECR
jgi:hypothetical protein